MGYWSGSSQPRREQRCARALTLLHGVARYAAECGDHRVVECDAEQLETPSDAGAIRRSGENLDGLRFRCFSPTACASRTARARVAGAAWAGGVVFHQEVSRSDLVEAIGASGNPVRGSQPRIRRPHTDEPLMPASVPISTYINLSPNISTSTVLPECRSQRLRRVDVKLPLQTTHLFCCNCRSWHSAFCLWVHPCRRV